MGKRSGLCSFVVCDFLCPYGLFSCLFIVCVGFFVVWGLVMGFFGGVVVSFWCFTVADTGPVVSLCSVSLQMLSHFQWQ